MTLPELSRRVSEAEGPSRELDVAIAAALYLKLEGGSFRLFRSIFADDAECAIYCEGHNDYWTHALPRYTASLDAVVALIAEKLPGYDFTIARTNRGVTIYARCGSEKRHFSKTPALALLAAALLAIHERQER